MPNKNWELNEITYSPFREEKNPSFQIGNKKGYISYIDYGAPNFRGDIFKFIQQLYSLSTLNEVLEKIDGDLELGIRSGISGKKYQEIVKEIKDPEINKRTAFIQVKARKFTKEDLIYWASYYQTEEDLRKNNIYSVKELTLNRQKFFLKEDELRFGYLYPPGNWKIYIPYTDNKQRKWLSNIPLTTCEGLENLKRGKNALILKSKKDYLVCIKIYPYCCYVQNESLAAFSMETVEYINDNSLDVFYFGDSDVPGKKASYAITETFGWKHINPPDRLLPNIKDPSDWAKKEGMEVLKEHLKLKNVL